MVASPSIPYRSANAGEFSDDARGRIDIKQYYSAGLAYKNIEPVPQSGFRQMGGTWRKSYSRAPLAAREISDPATPAGPHTGTATIWTGTVAGTVAAVLVSGLSIDAGSASVIVEAETEAGVWTAIGPGFAVAQTAVTRFCAFAPGLQRAATALRIRATFSEEAEVTLGAVAALFEDGAPEWPRFVALTTDSGSHLALFVTAACVDVLDDTGWLGAIHVPGLTAQMLPELGFYAEAATVGIFHQDLETVRLRLPDPAAPHVWDVDAWPYDPPPRVDLGGDYPKIDDKWEIFIRWSTSVEIFLTISVDGESTPGVPLGGGTGLSGSALFSDWDAFAADVEAAIEALPGVGPGVTVTQAVGSVNKSRKLTVTFGDALSGSEYQLTAIIANTADASALPYHIQIGDTEYEFLFSAERGWPGGTDLVQDRLGYYRITALTGALALSRVAEYFDLNLRSVTDNAARLDRLRSRTSEVILAIKESKYLLVFTNLGVYFVTSRTIDRNSPLPFVKASETGIAANCLPFDLEGVDYYVGRDANQAEDDPSGHQLLSIVYDDVSTSYNANPESLLASHLVTRIIRTARQRKSGDLDAAKAWLMRSDGRLVAAQMIRNQEIMGFCEWIAAQGGVVREIGVDGRNRLWLSIEWAGTITHQLYDPAIYLHDALAVTPDLTGVVSGLPADLEGVTLHAVADGWELPTGRVVDEGAIDLQDAYAAAIVGRWQPPRWESMPHVHITRSEDVIWRPGRIHTAHLNIKDTTSLAVGANGGAPQEVTLAEIGDPANQPTPPKTRLVTVTGEDLTGHAIGTTLVVTQLRPGRLRIKDLSVVAKL